jgi:fumarate hydratase subunit alpha
MISDDIIKRTTVEILQNAVTDLPKDINEGLQNAYEREESDIAKMQLRNILDNIDIAKSTTLPMCQDTGIHIFFVTFGRGMSMKVDDAIIAGLREATKKIPLRPNAVHPLTRENPGDNTGLKMPYINYRFSDEDYLEIAVMPKGAGSENMSALAMLNPSQGLHGIKEFALDTMLNAGGKPCPPIIIGMGVGGSADISMKLAKESLLRPIDQRNSDPQIAELENLISEAINDLGIGPMGLGGRTTALAVNREYAFCHTASLPVAINIQCWAARKAIARIHPDGSIEHITHPKEGSQ